MSRITKREHEALQCARDILYESRLYDGVLNLMKWDFKAYLPPSGRDWHVESRTFLTAKRAELFTAKESYRIADILAGADPDGWECDIDRGVVRRFLHCFYQCTKVPADLQIELTEAHFVCDAAWHAARAKNDYHIWRPALENYFEIKYKVCQLIDPNKHPLEVLMNDYDEDLTVDECGRLLKELKEGVSDIMFKVLPACEEVDDSFLDVFYESVSDVDALYRYLTHQFGYTSDKASFAKVVHAWSGSIGPHDGRVTVSRGNFGIDNLFTAVHEMGHSLYSIGSSKEVVDAGLWGGMTGSAHESQSRFYENMICRTPEFWNYFYPFVQERFPQVLGIPIEKFVRALLKVRPTLKRTTADELTYSIHPVIRFEIEKDMFDRVLDFSKLPEIWGDKYEESLGIRPDNDFEGCLQDVHWTEDFGKFQSYPMGNIFDGALRKCLLVDIPDFYNHLSNGYFDDINQWFKDQIHQHGYTYPTMELMRKVTGKEISSRDYLEYLEDKYFNLFGVAVDTPDVVD